MTHKGVILHIFVSLVTLIVETLAPTKWFVFGRLFTCMKYDPCQITHSGVILNIYVSLASFMVETHVTFQNVRH